jgi:glutamate racemase
MTPNLKKTMLPIGVFDSGLGGLTVLRELRKRLPAERFIYLGDTARAPYGSKSEETILRYAQECAHFLQVQGVKLVVVACNTVSAVALDVLAKDSSVPLVGTIDSAVNSVLELSEVQRIGVIGTQATIASQSYERALFQNKIDAQVLTKPCPLFVPLVENGLCEGEIVDRVIDLYLSDLRAARIDTLILGCTHYPMLTRALQKYFGARTRIVECSKSVAYSVSSLLAQQQLEQDSSGLLGDSERYFVTDDVARFNALASLFLEGHTVQAVQLESIASIIT